MVCAMNTILNTALLFFFLLTLSACGEQPAESPAAADATEAAQTRSEVPKMPEKEQPETGSQVANDPLFERSVTRRACDFLSPEAVAEVAGVDPSGIDQRSMGGMCLYSWDGGNASIGRMRTSKTVQSARASFEKSYRSHSAEEVRAGMDQAQGELEKQTAEGKTTIDPEQARLVMGTVATALADGLQFEPVQGVGDLAAFETTRNETEFGGRTVVSYANTLAVLTGNLRFSVSFARDGDPRHYRDENIALGQAALQALSQ